MNMKTNIVITGGSGFIGQHLCKYLEKDYNILDFSLEKNINLTDKDKLKKLLKETEPEFIIHLASSFSETAPKVNTNITLNLYESCTSLVKLKCIITFGSMEEYGDSEVPYKETNTLKPVSKYSLSKSIMWLISDHFVKMHDLPIVFVRPGVVYGELQNNNQLIPWTIRKCLKNEEIEMSKGEQTRDYVYIKDVVNAVGLILDKYKNAVGHTLNICSGKPTKIKKVIEKIKGLTNSKSKILFGARDYKKGEIMEYYGSCEKLTKLLSWQPKYSLEEGLKKTIQSYLEK